MIEIQLNYNYGYSWFSKDGIFVKGYIFDNENICLENEKLIEYFANIENESNFRDKLIKANGLFTVIIKKDNMVFLASDRTRTFPIFYSINNSSLYISDDTYYLKNKFESVMNNLSTQEFLSTGYVTGRETLLENIYQLQSGEYFVFNENKIKTEFYFNYSTKKISEEKFDNLKNSFLKILDNSIQRLIKLANGKKIVLPLSGGYDSRLIASLLKKHNYENIFCYTYGTKDSPEVQISRQVAEKLGYDWYFVEYNENTVKNDYPQTNEFLEYYKFASNHVSIFLTQDYFAVQYLHNNNLIPDDSIIVPGHTGDFISGGHIKNLSVNSSESLIINEIISNHYNLNNKTKTDNFFVKTRNFLQDGFSYSTYEDWELKERQSKFIINANRIYEYFGYKHVVPLWDNELIEFFRILSLEYKKGSYFYQKVIFENIFKVFSIEFKKGKHNKLKLLIRHIIPKQIINIIKKQLKNLNSDKKHVDHNNFNLLNTPIQEEVEIKYEFYEINSLLTNWYIKKIGNENVDL